MGTTLQIGRSIAGGLLILLGVGIFYQDSVARMNEGKRKFPEWNRFVALKNETPGWGFWFGLAAFVVGVLLLPI
jgi:hypothetical protein